MGQDVDKRIVEMRFDNAQFEAGVKTSIGTLDKLKSALKLDGASKGLEKVQETASHFTMGGMDAAVETTAQKFDFLYIAGKRAIENLVDVAFNAGEKIIKSITIDPVLSGWDKYAQKTQAVQTIMAATAKDFDDVNAQLEFVNENVGKLNWFTDETSYNFVDMVGNIGKFTANNLGLEQSVDAMQGIALWAALSGANANEASRAMYNLSQAVSLGAVTRQDWKSIENANMATYEFKQMVLETGVELGKLKKVGEDTYKFLGGGTVTPVNFVEDLKDKWFDTELLMATLEKYGSFATTLQQAYMDLDEEVTTSRLISWTEEFVAGTLDVQKVSKETGYAVEDLTNIFEVLGQEEYELGRKAFKAGQEAKTFQEAINATVDASSTAWLDIFETTFGNYLQAKVLWTDLANNLFDIFVQPIKDIDNVLEEAFQGSIAEGFFDDVFGPVEEVADNTSKSVEKVTKSFEDYKKMAHDVMTGVYGWTTEEQNTAMKKAGYDNWAVRDLISRVWYTTGTPGDTSKLTEADWKKAKSHIKDLTKVTDEATEAQTENYSKALEQIKAFGGLEHALESYTFAEDGLINNEGLKKAFKLTDEQVDKLWEFVDVCNAAGVSIDEAFNDPSILSGRNLFINGLKNILGNVADVGVAIKESFLSIFPPLTTNGIYNFTMKFHKLSTVLRLNEDQLETYKAGLQGLLTPLSLVTGGFLKLIGVGIDLGIKFVPAIRDLSMLVAGMFGELGSKLRVKVDKIANDENSFFNIAGTFFDKFTTAVAESLPAVGAAISENVSKWYEKLSQTEQFQKVKEHWNKAVVWIQEKFGNLKEWMKNYDFTQVESKLTGFIDSLFNFKETDLYKKINEKLKPIIDKINKKLGNIKLPSLDVTWLKNFSQQFNDWSDIKGLTGFDKFMGFFEFTAKRMEAYGVRNPVEVVMDWLGTAAQWFKDLGPKIITGFKALGKMISAIWPTILQFVFGTTEVNFPMVISTIQSVVKALLGLRLAGLVSAISDLWGVSDAIYGFTKAIKRQALANLIDAFGKAILMISGSLFIIATIPEDKLNKSIHTVGVIGIFVGALAATLGIIQKVTGGNGIGAGFGQIGAGVFLVTMVGSLILLATAIAKIDALTINNPEKVVSIIGGFVAAVALVMTSLKNVRAGGGIAAILSLYAIIKVLKMIPELIEEFDDFKFNENQNGVKSLALAAGAVVLAVNMINLNAKNASFSNVLQMAAMIIALKVIADSIKSIGKSLDEEQTSRAVAALSCVMVVFTALYEVIQWSSWFTSGKGKGQKLAIGVGSMVGALLAVTASIWLIGAMKEDKIHAATGAIAHLLAIVGVIYAEMSFMPDVSWGKVSAMLVGVGGILLEVASVFGLMKLFNIDGDAAEKYGDSLMKAMLAVSAVMLSMAIVEKLSYRGGLGSGGVTGILGILGKVMLVVGAIAVFVEALGAVINSVDTDYSNLEASVVFFTKVGEMVGNFLTEATSWIGPMMASIGEGIGDGLSSVGQGLTDFWESAKGFFTGIQGIPDNAVTKVGLLASAMEALAGAGMTNTWANVWSNLFGEGTALGNLGSDLCTFATNSSDFFSTIETIGPETVTSVGNLAEAIKKMADAEFLTGLNDLLDFSFGEGDDPGSEMTKFADAIRSFYTSLTADGVEFDPDVATNAIAIATAVGQMVESLPENAGIWTRIKGFTDLGTFSTDLETFGMAVVAFNDSIKGQTFDQTKVEEAAKAGAAIGDMIEKLPANEGIWTHIKGFTNMTTFNSDLTAYGTAIVEFSNTVKAAGAIDNASVENAAKAGTAIGDMIKGLAPNAGLITLWKDINMTEFCADLKSLGQGLVDLNGILVGDPLSEGTISTWFSAFNSILEYNGELEENDHLYDTNYMENLNTLITNLKEASESIDSIGDMSINLTMLDAMKTSFEDLSSWVQTFLTDDFYKSSSKKLKALKSFAKDLGEAMTSLTSGGNISENDASLFKVGANFVTAIVNGINSATADGNIFAGIGDTFHQSMMDIFGDSMNPEAIGMTMMSMIGKGINSGVSLLSRPMSTAISGAIAIVNLRKGNMSSAGRSLMTQLASGISSGSGEVSTASGSAASGGADQIRVHYSTFYSAGVYVMQGLIKGMQDMKGTVTSTAYSIGQSAANSANNGAKVASPSKITTYGGKMIAEGLIKGQTDSLNAVISASKTVGFKAATAVTTGVKLANAAVQNDMDLMPTITPVIDMSAPRTLDMSASVSNWVNKPVDSMSQIMATTQARIDASNQRVIDAVNGLRQDLSDFYNVDAPEINLYVDGKKMTSTLAPHMNRELNILSKKGAYR